MDRYRDAERESERERVERGSWLYAELPDR